MHSLEQVANAHPFIEGMAAMFAVAAIVDGMPAPKPTSGIGYVWAYNSLHSFTGRFFSLLGKTYPDLLPPQEGKPNA